MGAVHETDACEFPAVAITPAGGAASVAGVTVEELDEDGPPPAALMADTAKLYAVPFESPTTVQASTSGVTTA